jgi:predicted nucleic acid-binding protein
MTVVVDANILIAFALSDEPLHSQANQLLLQWKASNTRLSAPRLFRSEITAVIRKAVFLQRITHEQGKLLLPQLLQYPVKLVEDTALLTQAYELANRFGRPRAYDAQYLALAERLVCEFWTADKILFNSVQTDFQHICWLGNVVLL